MKIRLYPLFMAVAVAGLAGGIAWVEFDKSQLRRQIDHLRRNETGLVHVRTESERNRTLIARFKVSSEEGAKAMHGKLVAARAELAELEAKAGRLLAAAAATPSIDANRDPITAMTRLEVISEAGRGTPEAAFQTLIWAAMKGRESELAACVALDSAARAKAESLLAALPAETRAKYGTPEQLVGLVFSHGILEATAFQFLHASVADSDGRIILAVRIRTNGRDKETKIPMVRSADGWAMAVGEKQMDVIRRGLTGEPPPAR